MKEANLKKPVLYKALLTGIALGVWFWLLCTWIFHAKTAKMNWLPARLSTEHRSFIFQFIGSSVFFGIGFGFQWMVVLGRRRERAYREGEQWHRDVADLAEDFIFVVDRNDIVRYVNSYAARGYGLRKEEMIGKPRTAFFPPDVAARQGSNLRQVFDSGRAFTFEDRTIFPFGERWLNTRLVPWRDQTGKVTAVLGISRDITAQKQAEEALKDNIARYRILINTFPHGVEEVDTAGNITFGNEALHRIYGYPSGQMIGMNIFDLPADPAERQSLRELLSHLVAKQPFPFPHEGRSFRKDGQIIDVRADWAYQRDSAGQVVGFVAVITDVTSHKRAEQALRESEARYRAMVDNQTELVCRWLPDTTLTYVNHTYVAYFEKDRAALIGHRWITLVPDEQRPAVESFYRSVIASPRVGSYEHQVRRGDGTMRWIQWTDCPILDEEGRLIEFQSVGRDITEQREARQKREKLNEELDRLVRERTLELRRSNEELTREIQARRAMEETLRESEEKYRTIVENTLEVIMLTQPDGTISYLSPSCRDVLGHDPNDLVGRRPWIVHPEDSPAAKRMFATALGGSDGTNFEYRVRTQAGDTRWVAHSWKPILYDGRIKMIVSVVRDITDRKRTEEILKQTEKLAATGRMAARIAHEINNPLGGIKNSFQLIKNAVTRDHPYHSYVGRIEKEIDRIAGIVRQMFDLYRPGEEFIQEFSVSESVRDVVALLEPTCRDHEVTIETNLAPDAPPVKLSESLVRQILFNVIKNAVEASPPGGVVTVRARSDDRQVDLTVADRGVGVPEAARSRLFEPFFTTKSRQQSAGLGLGLSISKSIVESLNGTIEFESTPGQGTTFNITIPLHHLPGKA